MTAKSPFKTHQSIVLAYRLSLVLALYSLCRILFYLLNKDLFGSIALGNLGTILFGGLRFDISALLYLNSLYIVLFMLPIPYLYRKVWDTGCKWWFIVTNGLALLSNFADVVYYRFTLKRTTASVFGQFAHEQNKGKLAVDFLLDYWYLVLIFVASIWLLIKLYQFLEVKKRHFTWLGLVKDSISLVLVLGLSIIGMRGGWRHSTRPIAMSNAGDYISKPEESSIVLNTPFCIIKTLLVKPLPEVHYFNQQELERIYNPIHQPESKLPFKKLNVVVIIVESLGKEHIGSLNKDLANGTYKGYTPFIDSLVGQSLNFRYSFANGRKSIDGLPSILASIPSINEPYVLTTYGNNATQSLPALLKKEGYQTSFFHGAANGSMGFSAFTKQAGIDSYFGKTEYNNDVDFDGMWGIWDEPFLQYMANSLNTFKEPFFSSVFTTSSHHPFKVPQQYVGKFKKGPLPVQECIGYTDMALRKFF
ncbi:MAG: LTA synthase family protein, partial [Sphingobacteriaceae bacterium]